MAAASREELERLEDEERTVSNRRRRLHDQIDFLRASTGQPEVEERLAKLLAEERDVSIRRRELHAAIDGLRIELGIGTPGPSPKESLLDP